MKKRYFTPESKALARLYAVTKYRARIEGHEFSINLEDLILPKVCPVFKTPLQFSYGSRRTDNSPSLDRVDNSKGYTKDNIEIVSWRANYMKGNLTISDVETLLKYMKREL